MAKPTPLESPDDSSPQEPGSSAKESSIPSGLLPAGPQINMPIGDSQRDKESNLEEGTKSCAVLGSGKASADNVDENAPASVSPISAASQQPPPAIKQPLWKDIEAGAWCPAELSPFLDEELVNLHYRDEFSREEQAAMRGWKILGATRRGRAHANLGSHREDAFAFSSTAKSIVLCVSDGAGASQYSRIASELTVRRLSRELKEKFKRDEASLADMEETKLLKQIGTAMSEAVYAEITVLHEIAEKAKCKPKDFRCTLLLAVLYTSNKAKILLTSQVGDGFFAGLSNESKAQRFGTSDSGEFSGQVTCFIPDADAPAHASRIRQIDPDKVEALILCTDGIEDPFYPIERNARSIFDQLYHGVRETLPGFELQPEYGPVIGQPSSEERLRKWLSFEKKGENDDRTILILHRDPVGEVSQEIQSVETAKSAEPPMRNRHSESE